MGSKVKPVQPTEIKDKKIAREVIEQIRKPIPASVYRRHERVAKIIDEMMRK
jgi:predicted CoA-binding protein